MERLTQTARFFGGLGLPVVADPGPTPAVLEVARPASVPPDLAPGTRIGNKYALVRRVGNGAMGDVWAATHISLGEEVAIKIVMRDVAYQDGSSTESRFLLEARVASQLSRKTRHIVSVTDHGTDGPLAYLVMELLRGESLDARLARSGPMPLSKVIPLIYQVARALAVAHADGIVHRDLKPSNVFVTIDEEQRALIKILDFGIAKMKKSMRPAGLGSECESQAINETLSAAAKHSTMRGFLLGTPAYMSPEQARGRSIDHRADVWALAVIAYHLLTGQFPFDGATAEELFKRLCAVDPIKITAYRNDLPSAIVDLFDRAFHPHINKRFQSAVAFAGALEQIEVVQRRRDGLSPPPMISISVPPPPMTKKPSSSRPAPPPSSKTEGSSIVVAAGVPTRKKTMMRMAGAAALLAFLVGVGSQLAGYFEKTGGNGNGKTTASQGLAVGATGAAPPGRDESIPPPPDPSLSDPSPIAAARPQDLPQAPAAATPQAQQPATTTGAVFLAAPPPPQPIPTTASLPNDPPPAPPSIPQAQQPPPPKRGDRSDVF